MRDFQIKDTQQFWLKGIGDRSKRSMWNHLDKQVNDKREQVHSRQLYKMLLSAWL